MTPEQVAEGPAQAPLEELAPQHVMPIFSWVTESMDLSDRDRILERALNGEQQHPKALSTELFPGRAEVLAMLKTSQCQTPLAEELLTANALQELLALPWYK